MSYARPHAPTRQPKDLEYDLLARASQRLQAAWPERQSNYAGFIRALDENERLWVALASDVALSENGLPAELRAKLFYLYEFVSHHSTGLRANKGSCEVLVDINTAVMRGLRGQSTLVEPIARGSAA
jgi:flagellar protein FlaF